MSTTTGRADLTVYNCRRCHADLPLTGAEVEAIVENEGELRCTTPQNCTDRRPK